MATGNFIETGNFPIWAIDDDEFSDANGEYSQCRFEDWHAETMALVEQLNDDMRFHAAKLRSGYYCGVQLIVEADENPEMLDNDETRYYFDMCRSEAVRAYRREIRRVNKTLDRLAPNYGLSKYIASARFDNGETWYTAA